MHRNGTSCFKSHPKRLGSVQLIPFSNWTIFGGIFQIFISTVVFIKEKCFWMNECCGYYLYTAFHQVIDPIWNWFTVDTTDLPMGFHIFFFLYPPFSSSIAHIFSSSFLLWVRKGCDNCHLVVKTVGLIWHWISLHFQQLLKFYEMMFGVSYKQTNYCMKWNLCPKAMVLFLSFGLWIPDKFCLVQDATLSYQYSLFLGVR